jgi:hypothetical protein
MSKSMILNIETQTENNEVISLAHVNEKSLSLEISQDARIMYSKNLSLFNKINSSTRLLGGKLVRHFVTKSKNRVNTCMVLVDDSYESNDEEIAKLVFDPITGRLKLRRRAIIQKKKKVDFDPKRLKRSRKKNLFDAENISIDDLNEAVIVCQVQELPLFQDIGVKTFMFTDNLLDKQNIVSVAYELELVVDTEFTDYIDYVLGQIKQSINFISSYNSSLTTGKYFDHSQNKFIDPFVQDIMSQINVQYTDGLNVDMSDNTIRESDFGLAAINYYNGVLLINSKADKKMYKKIVKNLLPVESNDPENINLTLIKFIKLYDKVAEVYGRKLFGGFNTKGKSSVSASKKEFSKLSVKSRQKLNLHQDKLGYNIFSNSKKGLSRFTTSDYRRRYVSENRYYRNIKNSPELSILRSNELSKFLNVNKTAPKYLTPVGLVMGDDFIDTTRGLAAIKPSRIKEFRLLKSIKSTKENVETLIAPTPSSKILSKSLKSFNFALGKRVKSLMEEARESLTDPNVDVAEYVGPESFFITESPKTIRVNLKKLLLRQNRNTFNIISDIIPRKFLRPRTAIRSIRDFQISNVNSSMTGRLASGNINFDRVPPHLRAMTLDNFVMKKGLDPIKNSTSSGILNETQQNVFIIKALVGFKRDNRGFIDVYSPIFSDMDSSVLGSGRPILAKAHNYELPELGILKDKLSTTIYNNLIYIRG